MSQLRLIVGAGALDALRWAREHLYALLVLAPLVLGMTYFGVGRMVRDAEWEPSRGEGLALAVVAAACLVVLSMSRASAELYHPRRPEALLDTLPVGADTHLHAALARRLGRTLVVAAAAVVARRMTGGAFDFGLLAALVVFVALAATAEVFAALEWIHWGHRREGGHALAALVVSAASVVACGALLLSAVKPGHLSSRERGAALVGGLILTAALYGLSLALHRRWRAADIEYAKRLRARGRRGVVWESLLRRVGAGGSVTAQLARDLRLTLRGFSSAVYAAAGVAALWVLLLAAVLGAGLLPAEGGSSSSWLDATWLPRVLAVKFACVAAVSSLAALVPLLVAHQSPHFWLERAAGVSGEEAWRAKLYYARAVTLPAAVAAWAAGVVCGAAPAFYVLPLLGECLWVWWLVGTLTGGLAFETPEQPGLCVIMVVCVTLAFGGFTAFIWPMGLALYAFGLPQMLLRAQHRASLYLAGEEM